MPSENHIKTENIKQVTINVEEGEDQFLMVLVSGMQSRVFPKWNSVEQEENPLKCNTCESILHFAKDCPHSYANLNKSESVPLKVSVLFTGQKKRRKMSVLLSESVHSAILDSGCSSTVAGEQWITCYLDSLTPDELVEVKRDPSVTF